MKNQASRYNRSMPGGWTLIIFIAIVLIQVIGAIVQQVAKKQEEERMREAARQRREQASGSTSGHSRTAPPTASTAKRGTETSPQRAATRLDDLAARRKAQLEELRRKRLAERGTARGSRTAGADPTPSRQRGQTSEPTSRPRPTYEERPRREADRSRPTRVQTGGGMSGSPPGFRAPSGMTTAPRPLPPQQKPDVLPQRGGRTPTGAGGQRGGIDLSGVVNRPTDRRSTQKRARRQKSDRRSRSERPLIGERTTTRAKSKEAKEGMAGIRAALRGRDRLREAIVLREILDQPVSMRESADHRWG